MGPAGFVAVIAGWVTTEVGRQPYTVYGQLLTADSHSPLAAPAVAASLLVFVVVYFTVFGAGTGYLLRMMSRLPTPREDEPPHVAAACGRHHAGAGRSGRATERAAMSYSADLSLIWVRIIAFAVFAYVVMDGFDLGIGILFPRFAVGDERDQAMNSIAPVWDGNETWLVLGGGGLLAAFPLAYCHHPAGDLSAHHRDAAGSDFPRRGIRIPLARSGASALLGRRIHAWARRSRPSPRESPWARFCRVSGSCKCATPAAGSTG